VTAFNTLALAVVVLLIVLALARLTRIVVSLKTRLDALESASRTPSGSGSVPLVAQKTRSMRSTH
jgi:hypothetical protein